jgi:hypothetical protein
MGNKDKKPRTRLAVAFVVKSGARTSGIGWCLSLAERAGGVKFGWPTCKTGYLPDKNNESGYR